MLRRCHSAGAFQAAARSASRLRAEHGRSRPQAAAAEALRERRLARALEPACHERRREVCAQSHRQQPDDACEQARPRERRDGGGTVSRARDLRQRGGRCAEQQRRGDASGSERPAQQPCAAGLTTGRLRAQAEGDPAHDDRHHGKRERCQEDRPEGRESGRKSGEQDRDREDQPDMVCLPQRSDRARECGALLEAVAGGQIEDAGSEIGAGQDRVRGQSETETDRDEGGEAHLRPRPQSRSAAGRGSPSPPAALPRPSPR